MVLSKKGCVDRFASFEQHNVDTVDIIEYFDIMKRLALGRIQQGLSKGFTKNFHVKRDIRVLENNAEVIRIREKLHYLSDRDWFELWQSAINNAKQTSRNEKKRKQEKSQSPNSDAEDVQEKPKSKRHKKKPQKHNQSADSSDADNNDRKSQHIETQHIENNNDHHKAGIKMPPLAEIFFKFENRTGNTFDLPLETFSVPVLTLAQQSLRVITTRDLSFERFNTILWSHIKSGPDRFNIYCKGQWDKNDKMYVVFNSAKLKFHMPLEQMLLSSDEVSDSLEWTPTETPLLLFYVECYKSSDVDCYKSRLIAPKPGSRFWTFECTRDDRGGLDDSPGRKKEI